MLYHNKHLRTGATATLFNDSFYALKGARLGSAGSYDSHLVIMSFLGFSADDVHSRPSLRRMLHPLLFLLFISTIPPSLDANPARGVVSSGVRRSIVVGEAAAYLIDITSFFTIPLVPTCDEKGDMEM